MVRLTERKKRETWGWTLLVLAGIAAFSIYLEGLTPLFGDDFSYSVSFVTKARLASLGDVLASQRLHYLTTNGRAVVHTLAQILMWLGRPAMDVVYGLLLGTLCLLICVYWRGSFRKVEPWQPAAVFLFLWFFTPHFGGSYLWKMGAANYLLSPQLILLFFFPYRVWISRKGAGRGRPWQAVAMGVFGLLAGWTNENTSLALAAMVLLTLLLRLLRRLSSPLWMWTGLAGAAAGAVLLFFSPAQAARLAGSGGMGGLSVWLARMGPITRQAAACLWPLAAVWVLSLVLLIVKRRRADLWPAMITLAGFLAALYAMAASPEFPPWAWSSILAFALVFTGVLLYAALGEEAKAPPAFQLAVVLAAMLAVLLSWRGIAPELNRVRDAFDARETAIRTALAAGETDVTVSGIATLSTYSSYSLFPELGGDSAQWPNTAVANYYGLTSISLDGPPPLAALLEEGED